MLTTFRAACELKRKLATAFLAASLMVFALPALAQEHAPATPPPMPAAANAAALAQEHPTTPPAAGDHAKPAQGEHAAEAEHHDESIGGMILAMGWPVANFIIFLGVLYYYLNQPLKDYLAGRSSTIRKDLVEAAELRSTATAQLATIEQKLQALPGELAALRTRGAEDIKAEEQRIAAAAAADRERLLEQTRREIELQVRLAKKEILDHAADLSVQLATERIKKEVTPEDQSRLVDRYLDQVTKS
jgi:F-type H+-transporting ATPase subunit b